MCFVCSETESKSAQGFQLEQKTRITLKRPETAKIAENITARGILAYATLRFLNSAQLCRAQSPTRLCSKLWHAYIRGISGMFRVIRSVATRDSCKP